MFLAEIKIIMSLNSIMSELYNDTNIYLVVYKYFDFLKTGSFRQTKLRYKKKKKRSVCLVYYGG